MARIVDTTRFQAEGALIDWLVVARRLGQLETAALAGIHIPRVLQLRWMIRGDLGLPSGPFIVWRRPRKEKQLAPLSVESSTLGFLGGVRLVDWHETMSAVEVDVSGGAGGVFAFLGSPQLLNVVAIANAPGGAATLQLSAPAMDGLIVAPGVSINAVRGIPANDYSALAGWEKLELVGLPVPQAPWAGVGHHAGAQGMVAALTTPQNAALERLKRGAPPIGWGALIEPGRPAPPWISPDFLALIGTLNAELLDHLRPIVASFPPNQQIAQQRDVPVPPPENASGQQMSGAGGTSKVSPLGLTLISAGTDPHLALALGFGTAYPVIPAGVTGIAMLPDAMSFDYMITAEWQKGLDGVSEPVEYAALVPAPALAIAPPAPANPVTELMGHLRPLASDADWRCSIRVSWDRPLPIPLFRPRTYAFARVGVTPPEPPAALMEKRAGAWAPHTINETINPPDPESWRLHAVDRELPIPSNPGLRTHKYAVAHQDLYGQWSNWTPVNAVAVQPAPDRVRIVNAELKATPPASGPVCPGTLVIEFLWDWRIRRPLKIRFAGRLYPAAFHGSPPPSTAVPAGLQRSLSGADPFVEVNFSGDVPSVAGATIIGLNEAGDAQVPFGPAQGSEGRRYRMTIPGFSLNFASTGHIGLALWAQGQERIPPQRTGPWSAEPSVISVSDPRPPVLAPDIVTLASLPDASGECHARLSWAPSPGAAGYFLYESTETKILLANGLSEPTPEMTLSARLTRIKQAFRNNPSRREFTRRNARLINATSTDITLPRGSTAIHVFVVLGVSAGQVEANWPSGPNADDALQAFAAPRVVAPAAPALEAKTFLDTTVTPNVYRVRLEARTRKGARVARLDLHRVRVDDAARELNTMGPPVIAVSAGTPGWTLTEESDTFGAHIASAVGVDTPPGSWRRVWYRVVAWSARDALRGNLPGKSPASNACWVVVPPPDPPPLSALQLDAPSGGGPAEVLVKWTSSAPLKKTPLGPHLLSIRAAVIGSPAGTPPLIAYEGPLDKLATAQPATGSGAWRAGGSPPGPFEYRAILRRASLTDRVEFAIRITDPVGRTSERLLTIEAGSVLPPPVLEQFVLTPSVTPPGTMLSWMSDAPLEAFEAGAYMLRVTVLRPPRRLFLPLGPLVPQPPLILQLALGDIPLDEPGPVPPGVDPLRVRRMPGPGPKYSYYAFCRVPARQFIVRLTAPDDRLVEHVQQVS